MNVAHERQILRESIVAQLIGTAPNYRTSAGARVSKSRQAPVRAAELPAISVYNGDEDFKDGTEFSDEMDRLYQVTIVGWLAASENTDDALDALALEIETAMDRDRSIDRNAAHSFLMSTSFGEDLKGERPLGAVSLTYSCMYRTGPRVPAPTNVFATAGVKTNVKGTQAPADELSGVVTIPTV